MRVIAFTGKMGSGKSTAIEVLRKLTGKNIGLVKFAKPLYDMQQAIYELAGLPQPKAKDRKLLQWLGTEWGREMDPNLWVNRFTETAVKYLAHTDALIVCDDCRFDNEAETIKVLGGIVVKIHCDDLRRAERIEVKGETHASESGLKPELVDFVIHNNGTMPDLERQVRNMIERFEVET